MDNTKQQESIGPFKAVGVLLNTVGSAAIVVDSTIKSGGSAIVGAFDSIDMVVSKGNEALEIVLEGPIADLRCDQIVDNAHRKVRVFEAEEEAKRIIANIITKETNV